MRRRLSRKPRRRTNPPTWAPAFQTLAHRSDNHVKFFVGLAVILVLVSSALAAYSPIILKMIVDLLTAPGSMEGSYLTLGVLVAGYGVGHWLSRSFGELRSLAIGRADQRLHRRLSLHLFTHVMALPVRFHLDRKIGALSQTLTNGLMGYRLIVHHLVSSVLPVLLELTMIGGVLFALGHSMFLGIIGTTVVCYTIAFSIGTVKLKEPARAASTSQINAIALLTDSVLNYETVKYFCVEPRIHTRMDGAFAQTETHWVRLFSRKAQNGVLVATIFALSVGISVYLAALNVQDGSMSLGEFVLVNTYLLQILRPMEILGFAIQDISRGIAFIEKMLDVLRQEQAPTAITDGVSLPQSPGELTFENISFSYKQEHPILHDLSFTVPAGKTVAVVGASGAGKSSLVRLLVRFWEPSSGRILLDGLPITNFSASSLRDAIAVVPQDTILFNESIAYNIAIGRPDSSLDEIIAAARLANIHNYIVAREEGYETLVGERGLKLSGGEKQRIAIARAALKEPRIYVFDEATSSLDSKTERQILRNIRDVSQGTTTLMIAHRLSTIVASDEILVLGDGRIVERGTHRELLQSAGVYRSMWDAQQYDFHSPYGIINSSQPAS